MSYIALYRKYRSQSFGEVVGQEHVTTVLQNAIRMGRIAHAYLFCGPRGCGKTSTARLLARALNCQGRDGANTAPTPEPCGKCDLCVRIRSGAAMDVIEMDAASETGIDDVREKIIENAKYSPGEARFKVYIIDEVHDLSLKAFDSLLKTIEEPPAHVVFILATTEPHKVPITVRSRCQRMDFRRGTVRDLADNVQRVLEQEQIAFEPEAVAAVARAAEGSFRDSLSLLEQALAYTDGAKLTTDAVHNSIGLLGVELLDEIVLTLASDDMYAAFVKAGEVVESGKDVKQALAALQGQLRDLLVAGMASGPAALADVSAERFATLKERSKLLTPAQLLAMMGVLAEAERDLRFTNQHQRLFETALWKALPRNLPAAASVPHIQPAAQPARAPATARAAPREAPAPPAPARQREDRAVPPAPAKEADAALPQRQAAAHTGPAPAPHYAAEVDLEVLRRAWPRIRQRIVQRAPTASAYFGKESVLGLDGKFVVVGFTDDFAVAQVDKPKRRELVEQVIAAELGVHGLKLRCALAPPDAEGALAPSTLAPPVLPIDGVAVADTTMPAVPASALSDASGENGATAPTGMEEPPVVPDADAAFLQDVIREFDGKLVDT